MTTYVCRIKLYTYILYTGYWCELFIMQRLLWGSLVEGWVSPPQVGQPAYLMQGIVLVRVASSIRINFVMM